MPYKYIKLVINLPSPFSKLIPFLSINMVSCSHKTCFAFLPGFCFPLPLQYWIATDGGKKSYTVEAKTCVPWIV